MHDITRITIPTALENTPALSVVVHPTRALLNDWRDRNGMSEPDSVAMSRYDDELDPPFEMHLAADSIFLSIIAHECTHIALWDYGYGLLEGMPGARASAHITRHDETIPYSVGNLTALVFYALANEGFDLTPDDPEETAGPGIP